jgi:hypothetical protein
MFADPLYKDISDYKTKIASYNEALDNSKSIEAERDKLTQKYNAIDPNNLARMQKFLPDNVDNIRLILEMGRIAAPYSMVLKNVAYDSTEKASSSAPAGGEVATDKDSLFKSYGVWNLSFSTEGTYDTFLKFIKDLESNLRIVEIVSVQFSSDVAKNSTSKTATGINLYSNLSNKDVYTYNLKIKTYWLKN